MLIRKRLVENFSRNISRNISRSVKNVSRNVEVIIKNRKLVLNLIKIPTSVGIFIRSCKIFNS